MLLLLETTSLVPMVSRMLLIPMIHPGNTMLQVCELVPYGGEVDQFCSDFDDATLSMDLPSVGGGTVMIEPAVATKIDPIDFSEVTSFWNHCLNFSILSFRFSFLFRMSSSGSRKCAVTQSFMNFTVK
jgi:hypothetical protein